METQRGLLVFSIHWLVWQAFGASAGLESGDVSAAAVAAVRDPASNSF